MPPASTTFDSVVVRTHTDTHKAARTFRTMLDVLEQSIAWPMESISPHDDASRDEGRERMQLAVPIFLAMGHATRALIADVIGGDAQHGNHNMILDALTKYDAKEIPRCCLEFCTDRYYTSRKAGVLESRKRTEFLTVKDQDLLVLPNAVSKRKAFKDATLHFGFDYRFVPQLPCKSAEVRLELTPHCTVAATQSVTYGGDSDDSDVTEKDNSMKKKDSEWWPDQVKVVIYGPGVAKRSFLFTISEPQLLKQAFTLLKPRGGHTTTVPQCRGEVCGPLASEVARFCAQTWRLNVVAAHCTPEEATSRVCVFNKVFVSKASDYNTPALHRLSLVVHSSSIPCACALHDRRRAYVTSGKGRVVLQLQMCGRAFENGVCRFHDHDEPCKLSKVPGVCCSNLTASLSCYHKPTLCKKSGTKSSTTPFVARELPLEGKHAVHAATLINAAHRCAAKTDLLLPTTGTVISGSDSYNQMMNINEKYGRFIGTRLAEFVVKEEGSADYMTEEKLAQLDGVALRELSLGRLKRVLKKGSVRQILCAHTSDGTEVRIGGKSVSKYAKEFDPPLPANDLAKRHTGLFPLQDERRGKKPKTR